MTIKQTATLLSLLITTHPLINAGGAVRKLAVPAIVGASGLVAGFAIGATAGAGVQREIYMKKQVECEKHRMIQDSIENDSVVCSLVFDTKTYEGAITFNTSVYYINYHNVLKQLILAHVIEGETRLDDVTWRCVWEKEALNKYGQTFVQEVQDQIKYLMDNLPE